MRNWTLENKLLSIIFLSITCIYLYGLSLPLLGLDSSQYAELSRQMLETGNYSKIQLDGLDYLDKPPLLFWLGSLSFSVFGVSEFTFRLPSFLFSLIAAYGTFLIGKELYNKRVGKYSSLMLLSSIAFFMINIDVRTDTILIGAITFSTAKLIQYHKYSKWKDLILGFFFIGIAMCSKGPLGLLIPIIAVGTHLLFKKELKALLDWKLLIGFTITIITIAPLLISLYTQWDLHPEKMLYGVKNISGVKFFLWDQSFGRITGTNPFINNMKELQSNDPFYFGHTLLWAFLPWTILGFSKLFKNIVSLVKRQKNTEYYTLGAIVIPIIILSFSSYKLPHYIFICLPFLSVLSAQFLFEKNHKRWLKYVHIVPISIIVLFTLLIFTFSFPTTNFLQWSILILMLICLIIFIIQKQQQTTFFLLICSISILFHLSLYTHFYPNLLSFDSAISAGEKIKAANQSRTISYDSNRIDQDWKTLSYSLEFYSENINEICFTIEELSKYRNQDLWVYTSELELLDLENKGWVKEKIAYQHFPTSKINLSFFIPSKRELMVTNKYLVKI
jgi:4-amino-4-deoxy-L-arabinose transferase-like glycosyltransferase